MANNAFKVDKSLNLRPQSGTPANGVNGDIYYDSSLNKFRKYENGAWSDLAGAGTSTTIVDEEFTSGVNYTAGTTTQLTLSQAYGNEVNLWVFFDGGFQAPDSYSIASTVITFNAPIPIGVSKVYIKGVVSSSVITIPSTSFISNGSAESSTSGWAVYADAAQSSPIDGSGGTSNVTVTRSTSSPLSGGASFLLTKDAVNRQGQGWSYDFSIDDANKAKVLKIDFDYLVASGTFTAGNPADRTVAGDSTVSVWIYDVTNGVVIQPSTYRLFSNSATIADKFSAYFQTSSNSTSYRLIFHVGSSAGSAFVLKVDNVAVSPSQYIYGTPVTDWVAYTPTWTSIGTQPSIGNGQVLGRWRRVGDSAEYNISIISGTTTTFGTSTYRYGLPAGHVIDTTKLARAVASEENVTLGVWNSRNQGVTRYKGWVTPISSTQLAAFGNAASANGVVPTANEAVSSAYPFTAVAGADSYTMYLAVASVPIVGWSSSVQMSDSADTRVVSFVASVTGQSLTGGVTNIVATAFKDTHGAWTGSTYIVPVPGDYVVSPVLYSGPTAFTTTAYVDGVFAAYLSGSVAGQVGGGSVILPSLRAGQAISFRSGVSVTLATDPAQRLSISRISGPSAIAATETIAEIRVNTAGTSIATSGTVIPYATVERSTHGTWDATNHRFIAPASGLYAVNMVYQHNTGSSANARPAETRIKLNGSPIASIANRTPSGATTDGSYGDRVGEMLSTHVYMRAGDYLDFDAFSAGAASTLVAGFGANRISIVRVGL